MPIIERKVVHSFSSEDTNFPASNLLETRVTKKYKCKEVGEKLVFVVFKLVKPTQIVTIDIGNEHSAFIEVFVASSKQNTPEFKEILMASSFMTPVESRKSENPNRVRCFNKSTLIEGICDEKWDLVKIVCTQPFARVQYGLSFITLHSPSEESDKDENGFKCKPEQKSSEKRKFGKFYLRNDSDEDTEKKDESLSAYHKWKLSKDDKSSSPVTKSTLLSSSSAKTTMKEKVQTMKESEKRKRIVLMDDSSDEEISKPKQSRSRTNLMYDEDDELPNEKMEEKINKDRESSKKSHNKDDNKKRDKTPPRTDSKNKFSSFIEDETPSKSKSSSSSSHHHKSSSSSSRDKRDTPSKSSSHSSRSESKSSSDKKSSSHSSSRSTHKDSPNKSSSSHTSRRSSKDSPDKKSSSRSKSKSTPDKRTSSSRSSNPSPPNKNVSYKPFSKLLEGVVIVFSGYQNPERGILRQKAIDMGAKYKADWENSCTHLICAFKNTPKYNQIKGNGKIVSKSWIEKCFQEQKKISWRKYALDDNERKQSDSEDEIVNILLKPKSSEAVEEATVDSPAKDNDSSLEIISPKKTLIDVSSDEDMDVVDNRKPIPSIEKVEEPSKNGSITKEHDPANATTDEDVDHKQDDDSFENTQSEAPLFSSKTFFLHADLMATDIVKLEKFIPSMKGKIIKDASIANYVVTNFGRNLPKGMKGEAVKALWIYEIVEMECLIPIQRYKFDL
ncbi:unnamed protein product [Diamesa tonsa]